MVAASHDPGEAQDGVGGRAHDNNLDLNTCKCANTNTVNIYGEAQYGVGGPMTLRISFESITTALRPV